MPSPVPFTVTITPLPENGSWTPQELAVAIADRLTVAPGESWNSFSVGSPSSSVIPVTNLGPFLFQEVEWRVWDQSLGSYTYHRQHGDGLIDETVGLGKLADLSAAGSVLISNGSKRPAELLAASGTSGQVLTLVGGTTPTWVDTFVPGTTYFQSTLSVDQNINTNSSVHIAAFDTVQFQANVTFDTANNRVPVTSGQVWFFYAQLQVEDVGAASTSVQLQLDIRLNGVAQASSVTNYTTAQSRFGASASGVVKITGSGHVDVAVTVGETTPANPGVKIAGNATNTRFGGFRIV